MAFQLLIVVALAASITARPSNLTSDLDVHESTIDQNSALVLDDMRFIEGQLEELKSGTTLKSRRWPAGVVTYNIDPSLFFSRPQIQRAMKHIEDLTCIRFRESIFPFGNYLNFFLGQGCYTYVGMTGGRQPLSLGNGCHYIGTIIHEILHALGCFHEHSRADRDDYIDIFFDNIKPGLGNQFAKLTPEQEETFNIPYNPRSIMHYGEEAFTKQGGLKTMVSKNSQVKLTEPYSKNGMTDTDIQLVKSLYDC